MEILVLIIVCGALQFFLPWWSMVLASFIIGFTMAKTAKQAFVKGSIAIALLWATAATIQYFSGAEIIVSRIAPIFRISPVLAIVFTGFIGGITAGVTTLSGYRTKQIFS